MNTYYIHPLTAELQTKHEWLQEYYNLRDVDDLASFFCYELEEGQQYPSNRKEILRFLVPYDFNIEDLERQAVEILCTEGRMRLR